MWRCGASRAARDAVRPWARKPPSTRLGEAAVPVARANRQWAPGRASGSLDDAPQDPRLPSCPPNGPTDRPSDLYGSLLRIIGIRRRGSGLHPAPAGQGPPDHVLARQVPNLPALPVGLHLGPGAAPCNLGRPPEPAGRHLADTARIGAGKVGIGDDHLGPFGQPLVDLDGSGPAIPSHCQPHRAGGRGEATPPALPGAPASRR